ncbi:MAG TPA: TolC family protein [Burkholderiales bacterium]|nr:TolC family protein [Burkholderiales bacterium]
MHLAGIARVAACLLIAAAAPRAAAQALSLDDAIRIGEARSARLAAQSAAVTAASDLAGRAAQLPDPKLKFGLENVPVSGADAWSLTQDFMTMKRIGVMQDILNGDKRRARGERAARELGVEQAGLVLERTNLRREIAVAWYEVLHATRALEVMGDLVNAVALQQETVGAAIAAGRAPAADGFMARSALETARDQVIDQERVLARARLQLAVFVGDDAQRPVGAAPDTSRLAVPVATLLESLDRQPTLQVLERRAALARSDVALAQSTKTPDWGVELSFGQRTPYFSNMLSLMFSVDLPVFPADRQDRDVAASLAQVERARAQLEDARRTYTAQVRGLAVDYETWNRRVERFEKVLIPLGQERAEAALAAYRGGKGELMAVIEARKAEAETRLGLHNALLERGRAWAGLTYLVPQEETKQ